MKVFIVTAYRWGSRANHSYLVGVYSTHGIACEMAETHTTWRGGKYACTVEEDGIDKSDGESGAGDQNIIYRTKCMLDQKDVQTMPTTSAGYIETKTAYVSKTITPVSM